MSTEQAKPSFPHFVSPAQRWSVAALVVAALACCAATPQPGDLKPIPTGCSVCSACMARLDHDRVYTSITPDAGWSFDPRIPSALYTTRTTTTGTNVSMRRDLARTGDGPKGTSEWRLSSPLTEADASPTLQIQLTTSAGVKEKRDIPITVCPFEAPR